MIMFTSCSGCLSKGVSFWGNLFGGVIQGILCPVSGSLSVCVCWGGHVLGASVQCPAGSLSGDSL